jgi:hypothetical protein
MPWNIYLITEDLQIQIDWTALVKYNDLVVCLLLEQQCDSSVFI